jgi:hypothetical protein
VFKYMLAGTFISSWSLAAANGSPTGITLDPSGASNNLWTVDPATDAIYEYVNALGDGGGSLGATYALAAANTNPQGIADPPPPSLTSTEIESVQLDASIALATRLESDDEVARIVDQLLAGDFIGPRLARQGVQPLNVVDRLFEADDLWPAESNEPLPSHDRLVDTLPDDPALLLAEVLIGK